MIGCLRTHVRKQPIIGLYFESENVLKFYNLEARFELNAKVSKGAKIRNRYNQVPHLTQDTNGKVTNSQLNTTNESQAGDHKAHINRRAQRHIKHKTEKAQKIRKRSTALERPSLICFVKYLANLDSVVGYQ